MKVVIGWIPEYTGIYGNELADNLAKQGTKEKKDVRIKVSIRNWKSKYKKEMMLHTRIIMKSELDRKGKKFFGKYYRKEERKV